jgi:hypothetical protein
MLQMGLVPAAQVPSGEAVGSPNNERYLGGADEQQVGGRWVRCCGQPVQALLRCPGLESPDTKAVRGLLTHNAVARATWLRPRSTAFPHD